MSAQHTPDYRIEADGRVFSISSNWRGYGEREMMWSLNDDGYPSVRITIDGKRKRMAVHRLVAQAFLPPKPSPDHQIRHMDGNKMNPRKENLSWGTAKENADDRSAHGRTSQGANHSKAIKGSNQAEALRNYWANARAAIAKATGAE